MKKDNNLPEIIPIFPLSNFIIFPKTTVPLISSGVGTLTKVANWKQSPWNNILLNPNGPYIDIFERNTGETWDNIFNLILQDILKLKK